MMPSSLPLPVSSFIAAVNAFDLERLLDTFADDALVNDHRDEFVGKDQIRAWAAREIIGDRVTMNVVDVRRVGGQVALKAEIDGNFDKKGLPSRLVLSFYFSVEGARIAQLVITFNKVDAGPPATSPAEAHKATVRRFFERFSAGDIPGAVALFHDDATYWLPTTRETLTMPGLTEALRWIQSRLAGPISYELGAMVADDRAVAVQLEGLGTTIDGRPYRNRHHVYFEFDGDKIRCARDYNDTAHVFATLRRGESAGA